MDEDRLRRALGLEMPYEDRLSGTTGAAAAVLVAFGRESGGEWSLLYVKRADSGDSHSGQMAFPGGKVEPGEGVSAAALREAEEEVGLPRDRVRLVGELPRLLTVTGFLVTPVVGILETALDEVPLRLDEREIAAATWVRLSVLESPGTYRREFVQVGPLRHPIHVYAAQGHRIWGATGAMTKNLLDRLRALG